MTRLNLASLVDREAELSVLGGVLIRPDLLPLLDIDTDCFHDPHNAHVWAAMRNLEAAGKPIDVTTVADQLEKDGHLNTPISLLGECALHVPTPENVEHYAEILRRHRIGRDVAKAIGSVLAKLTAGEIDGPDALVETQAHLSKIETGERDDRALTVGAIVRNIAEEFSRDDVEPECMRTGLSQLDAKTGGLPYGVPTMVLAPPGSGKSTLALTFAEAAETQGDTPLLYTYEDGHRSFGMRIMARHSGVPTEVIRSRSFERGQLDSIGWHMSTVLKRRTVIVRAVGMTVEDLIRDARSRRLKHKGPGTTGRLILVDFIQLMPTPTGMHRSATANERMGVVVKRLAEFAGTEGVALVLFSQVGRQVPKEARPPSLVDARDCGEIEIVAKLMLGLFRPGVYKLPPTDSDTKAAAPLSLLELHIIKNNQGETGCHAEAYWDLPTHTIVDSRDDLAGRIRR